MLKQTHQIKEKMPIFSVAIPVHNRTKDLVMAIDSVMHQTLDSFEIILVTNGSPKDTLDIINHYVNQNKNKIRAFYYEDNTGNACRGRNRAIIEARGEYISFLDSDDSYLKHTLATVLNAFQLSGADVVAGCVEWEVDGSRQVDGVYNGFRNRPCPVNVPVLLRNNPFMTCAVHIRRDVLLKFGGFRPQQRYLEDLECWLRLANNGCKFFYSPEILAKYKLHAGNTELNFIDEKSEWFRKMWSVYKEPFNDWGV